MIEPTVQLRFVKRRVGANTVRILQQKWQDPMLLVDDEWRDVELADPDRATPREFPPDAH